MLRWQVLTIKIRLIMITTYTFSKKNNNNNIFSFQKSSSKPNYSKILDDIIISDVIDKNDYLFKNTYNKKKEDSIIFKSLLNNSSSKLDNAIKFLANYKNIKKNYSIPYIYGKMYTLTDGTPIVFYDDEIQIGFDTFKYNDFSDSLFLSNLSANTKKLIINIYINGAANIDINIL